MQRAGREFFVSGGTLPLDSESYVERSADKELLDHLAAGRYCYVLNARQMGKSSLSVRTIARLGELGVRTVFIDLTQIGGRNVQVDQWYAGLTGEVGRGLGLTAEVLSFFKSKPELSPMQRFFSAIREVVLQQVLEPIVIFIDEIDATRNLPFQTDEFFAGIRECFNRRVHDESCRRLTFCLIGVAVPTDLIRDSATTPFNVGERISLEDFSLAEIRTFGSALGANGERLSRRVHHWTNGQPFLTQTLCREIASDSSLQDEEAVDRLVRRLFLGPKAVDNNLNLSDVANRVLSDPERSDNPEKYRADVLSAYDRVWKGGWIADDEANRISVALKLSGILRAEGARLVVRNRIYRTVFDHAWVKANMPGQELSRQRSSFRRGLLRGVVLSALVAGIIGALALLALNARHEASAAKTALDYELYVADMNSLRLYEGTGDGPRMASILERSKSNSHRGFEWGLWMGRLHDSPEEYTLDYATAGKLEEGILSKDGRQICIVDRLADVAVVVDRKTGKALGSQNLGSRKVVATRIGFLIFDFGKGPHPVVRVDNGDFVCQIGTPGYDIEDFAGKDMSNVVLASEIRGSPHKDHLLTLWDLTTGKCLLKHRPKDQLFHAKYLVSESGNRIAYFDPPPQGAGNPPDAPEHLVVWDTAKNREFDRIPFPAGSDVASISPSGRLLAYWDEHHSPRLRDIDRRQTILSSIEPGDEAPISISISPDDRTMAVTTSNGVTSIHEIPSGRTLAVRTNLWRITPGAQESTWVGSSSSVRVMNFTPGGQGIVGDGHSVARDGLGSLRLFVDIEHAIGRLSDPSLSHQSSIALPTASSHTTYNGLWCVSLDQPISKELISVGGSSPSVPLSFHPENIACGLHAEPFAAMMSGGTWQGISGSTGKALWKRKYTPGFRGMWMSPDSHRLVASTWDGHITSIDPETGNELLKTAAHHLRLSSLNFSPDGKLFVTGGGDGLAILWETDSLRKLVEFRVNAGQEVECADISPDGKRIVTCNVTGAFQLWDRATGDQLTEIKASDLPLRSVLFTSDGRKIVTAGDDGIVRSWSTLDSDPTIRISVPQSAAKNIEF